MNDERDPGDEHRDQASAPRPDLDKFVRYGPGPGDYFEPVNDWRLPSQRGRICRDGIHTWVEDDK